MVQLQPVIDLLLANPNVASRQGKPDVILSLVNVTAQLTRNHLKHKKSISLLPSAEILIPTATGTGVDKLDDSAWLLQLFFLIVEILQDSVTKLHENTRNHEPLVGSAAVDSSKGSTEVQDITNTSNSSNTLIDKLVSTKEILLCLMECLNQCSSDKLLGSPNLSVLLSQDKWPADVKISVRPTSIEDGVLQLLTVVQNNVTDNEAVVDGIIAFIRMSSADTLQSARVKHLSDPFLWLLFKVLNSSQAVTQFSQKGKSQ